MNDTPEEISQMQFEMMMRLGLEKRLAYASDMYMAAREFVIRSLPADISARERNKKIVERLYSRELAEEVYGRE